MPMIFIAYAYLRDNPAGIHRELWFRETATAWLVVTRNSLTMKSLKLNWLQPWYERKHNDWR